MSWLRRMLVFCSVSLFLTAFTSSAGAVDYTFDGAGRVVVRVEDDGETVTRYAYDGTGELVAVNGQAVLLGPMGEFAQLDGERTFRAASPGGPIVQRGAVSEYTMPDQLGTTRATVAGVPEVERAHYDAFGGERAAQVSGMGYGFTGALSLRGDTVLGERTYVSAIGSFNARDSGAFMAGGVPLNRYAYVSGRVTTRVDPTGHFEVPVPGTGLVITNENVPERLSRRSRAFLAGARAGARESHQGGYVGPYPGDLLERLTAPLPSEREPGPFDWAGQQAGEVFAGITDELLAPGAGIVKPGRVDPSWFMPDGRLRVVRGLLARMSREVNPRCVIYGNCGDCSIIGALAMRHPIDAVPPLPAAPGSRMRLAPDSEAMWLDTPVVRALESLMAPGSAGLIGSSAYDGVRVNGYGPTLNYDGSDHAQTVVRALDGSIHTIDFQRGGIITSDPDIINGRFSQRPAAEFTPRRRRPL